MKYITFLPNKHQIGGLGHSFCDYLSAFIISEIFDDIKFIHNDLLTTNQKRKMLVDNNNKFNWNEFLNLKLLDQNDNKKIIYNEIKISNSFQNINLKNIKKLIKDNRINYLIKNNRILLFDLYYYELNNLVPKNTTINPKNKLKKNLYLINEKNEKKKKIFNIYLRRGDFNNKNHIHTFNDPFIIDTLNIIYKLININNYDINIISAGTLKQMNDIKNKYKLFNVNFLLNQKEKSIFYTLTQSDILLFYNSSFPLTASLFCDGLIIKKKKDNYIYKACLNKEIKFLDNYIITDKLDSNDIEKINNFL
jgi:hypothetical protein